MDRYQVKFERHGETIYGLCESYGEEAEAAQKRGEVIVSDAVLPVRYRVPEKLLVDIPSVIGLYNHPTGKFDGCDEYHKYVEDQFEQARNLSDSLAAGVQVGALFGLGVGDGTAWYVVTKVGKRTCRVEWRGFCMDRYYDHHFGSGGSFSITDVARYVDQQRAWKRTRGSKSS